MFNIDHWKTVSIITNSLQRFGYVLSNYTEIMNTYNLIWNNINYLDIALKKYQLYFYSRYLTYAFYDIYLHINNLKYKKQHYQSLETLECLKKY